MGLKPGARSRNHSGADEAPSNILCSSLARSGENVLPPLGGNCEPREKVADETIDTIGLVGSYADFDDLLLFQRIGEPGLILAVPQDQGNLVRGSAAGTGVGLFVAWMIDRWLEEWPAPLHLRL